MFIDISFAHYIFQLWNSSLKFTYYNYNYYYYYYHNIPGVDYTGEPVIQGIQDNLQNKIKAEENHFKNPGVIEDKI